MQNPIHNEIGTVFVPVKHIEEARDWYCDLLGLPPTEEVQFGHLYVLPMKGTGIVLDSKIYSEENILKTPLFHLNTDDIHAAYAYMKEKQVQFVYDIQYDHYFVIKDPDGNHLMVCQC
ncbi:VOC family protein [Pontibacillus salicampi]|uniref:VOC family protein n=1 Tax=Pontibacillus salicampi TaxID=1449801 RepID=A0ABV6LQ42_9BACI